MGSEADALEIMLQNPSILHCGSDLSTQPADQIRSFAKFRSVVDRIPASATLTVVAVLFSVFLANFMIIRSDDPSVQQAADLVKPVLGATGGTLFIGAVGLSAMAGGNGAAAAKARRDDRS